jgi:hypothetical protein
MVWLISQHLEFELRADFAQDKFSVVLSWQLATFLKRPVHFLTD